MTASITPYLAFGKATPRIFLGLSSSLLFSSDIMIFRLKRALQRNVAPKFYFILPISNIAFVVVCTMSFPRQSFQFLTFRF